MLYNAGNYQKAVVMDEQYLTVDDVAERLQVSRVTVYNFINTGKLESIKIGKSRRVTSTALQSFLHQNVDRKDHSTNSPQATKDGGQ